MRLVQVCMRSTAGAPEETRHSARIPGFRGHNQSSYEVCAVSRRISTYLQNKCLFYAKDTFRSEVEGRHGVAPEGGGPPPEGLGQTEVLFCILHPVAPIEVIR
jgi:hypothetical protein